MSYADATTDVRTGVSADSIEYYILKNRRRVVSWFFRFLVFGFVSIVLIAVWAVAMLSDGVSWLPICGGFAAWTICLTVICGMNFTKDFLNLLACYEERRDHISRYPDDRIATN